MEKFELKKIYFASDLHLGLLGFEESLKREKLFVKWLDEIKKDASEIFLLGDMFDFWFEYKRVVPRGFTRFLGKLAEICDSGIPVHFFTGNHDLWVFDYLEKETGVIIHREPLKFERFGKIFLVGHGDGLGPGDHGFKRMKAVFTNSFAKWLFARIHPNCGVGIAHKWSYKSRINEKPDTYEFKGADGEWLIQYSKDILKKERVDYFIFGHRHIAVDIPISESSRFINIGDWINNYTFAVFDGSDLELKNFLK